MQEKEIYWHLPGLCYFRVLNQCLLALMKKYPDCFRDGYKIGSVYGTVPGAIWNGGRTYIGVMGRFEIKAMLNYYNSQGIPVRFTWTNSVLEEKHLQDTYCNLIMRLADNGMNQVLVNTDILAQYIRKEYPGFPIMSSTTKRITDLSELKNEFEKDYRLVVLDYDLNNSEEALKIIEPFADRVELMVNEICVPNCQYRVEHYRHQSKMQLEYENTERFKCPNRTHERTFESCKQLPAFLSNEKIEKLVERGFVNFKIAGRGMPQDFLKESYLYFLVKDDRREFVKEEMERMLDSVRNAGQGKTVTK